MFDGIDTDSLDLLISDKNLADGGASMTTYSRMLFTEMTYAESREIQNALLKYCELDTLGMVMIWEYWKNELYLSDCCVPRTRVFINYSCIS